MKIGLLTSGGDCPGLNAVIRAVVKTAINEVGAEVVGIEDGFHGLLEPTRTRALGFDEVRGLLPRGGTILGSSNRGNPFSWCEGGGEPSDRSAELVANADRLGLDAVVTIGGDGSLVIAHQLAACGLRVVAVPKTIDNDVACTDLAVGFDTAVGTATDAIDRLHTTAESHHRVMVIELMGRHVGWIALASGIAGGADVILIPEIPYAIESVCASIESRVARGRRFSIVVVAEGALPAGGAATYVESESGRLGGVGNRVACEIAAHTGRESRATILGHIQRGGSPSPFDRVLATRLGAAAARTAGAGRTDCMVGLRGTSIVEVPLAKAVVGSRAVPPDGELVRTARALGIGFGDPEMSSR